MRHYQLWFSLDEKLRGGHEMPHTISIESERFLEYMSDKAKNVSAYFENKKGLYEDMPDELSGRLMERNSVVDFMDFTPACLSLVAVVSENVKRIFEGLNVSKNEYVLRKIAVEGFGERFYLLFIPLISDVEFVYPKCVFEDMFDEGVTKTFCDRAEYYGDSNYYCLKKVTLGRSYEDWDLLYPQGGGFFFSERIVDAMRQEGVVGYDIVRGGCFYEEIDFE